MFRLENEIGGQREGLEESGFDFEREIGEREEVKRQIRGER